MCWANRRYHKSCAPRVAPAASVPGAFLDDTLVDDLFDQPPACTTRQGGERVIFFHTLQNRLLQPGDLNKTLKFFWESMRRVIKRADSVFLRLNVPTVSDLRHLGPTIRFVAWQQRRLWPEISTARECLDRLAMTINSSSEQLQRTYLLVPVGERDDDGFALSTSDPHLEAALARLGGGDRGPSAAGTTTGRAQPRALNEEWGDDLDGMQLLSRFTFPMCSHLFFFYLILTPSPRPRPPCAYPPWIFPHVPLRGSKN
jgi:hypothetical protein